MLTYKNTHTSFINKNRYLSTDIKMQISSTNLLIHDEYVCYFTPILTLYH